VQATDFGGARVTGIADPTSHQDAATKAYVDATAFEMAGGGLPGQAGSAGQLLATDGLNASWGPIKLQSTLTTGLLFSLTSNGDRLGGFYSSSTTGEVGFVNSGGMTRFKTSPSGRAYLSSDDLPAVFNEIATQDLVIAYAVSL
jgi:hypothetical protein